MIACPVSMAVVVEEPFLSWLPTEGGFVFLDEHGFHHFILTGACWKWVGCVHLWGFEHTASIGVTPAHKVVGDRCAGILNRPFAK